jgi:hypothetical protein
VRDQVSHPYKTTAPSKKKRRHLKQNEFTQNNLVSVFITMTSEISTK